MKLSSRIIAAVVASLPLALIAGPAHADTPCGKFDFTSGINCKIEVEGGCTADCKPLNFEAGCSGGCSGSAMTTCVNDCGTQCVAMCDPAHLDCFAGCHGECDQPTIDTCKAKQPTADCVSTAKAQCDIHCNDACKVPPSDCTEHCNRCCTGSCTTQINFDCDFQCFAKLSGGCDVQCKDPKGAIFCNGQYVGASDVDQCISYLSTQGIKVDVSARGTVDCNLSGCKGTGSATGCSASPGVNAGAGGAALAILGLAAGMTARRRRQRRAA